MEMAYIYWMVIVYLLWRVITYKIALKRETYILTAIAHDATVGIQQARREITKNIISTKEKKFLLDLLNTVTRTVDYPPPEMVKTWGYKDTVDMTEAIKTRFSMKRN